jgi:hypothetical protein
MRTRLLRRIRETHRFSYNDESQCFEATEKSKQDDPIILTSENGLLFLIYNVMVLKYGETQASKYWKKAMY